MTHGPYGLGLSKNSGRSYKMTGHHTSAFLLIAAGILAIGFSLLITDNLHTFAHRNDLYSQTEPLTESVAEVALTEAPALTFDELLDAIEWVESKGDPWAVGDNGNAVGAYQIWKIYVDDVNRIDKRVGLLKFNYNQRYSRDLSRKMVTIYLKHYGGTFEEMARKHNGGPTGHKKESTKAYWLRVKARMEKVRIVEKTDLKGSDNGAKPSTE